MYKLVIIATIVTLALCQEDVLQYQPYEEEILIPIEVLPPGTLVRAKRQVFGGISGLPTGGYNQQFGLRAPIYQTPTRDLSAWGSLSQNFNRQRHSSPITYSGGADFKAPLGGLSASASHVPKFGTQATLEGHVNLLTTPKHNLNAFASHTKTFDPNFREVGKGSTTAGLGYQHVSGGSLHASGTNTPGAPNSASLGASVPLYQGKDSSLNLNAQSTLTQGQKPNNQVGVTYTKTW